MKREYLIESCVESYSEAISAQRNGADLIELCSYLMFDGLTPELSLVINLLKELTIPIKVMVRPRKGNFIYNSDEREIIVKQVQTFKDIGVKEIVFGAIKNNSLDIELIQHVAKIAFPMNLTVHKAIDYSNSPLRDISALKPIAQDISVLTSGCANTAKLGHKRIKEMKKVAGNSIKIIAAGKITFENLSEIHSLLGLSHYHGRRIVKH